MAVPPVRPIMSTPHALQVLRHLRTCCKDADHAGREIRLFNGLRDYSAMLAEILARAYNDGAGPPERRYDLHAHQHDRPLYVRMAKTVQWVVQQQPRHSGRCAALPAERGGIARRLRQIIDRRAIDSSRCAQAERPASSIHAILSRQSLRGHPPNAYTP